MRGGWVVSGMTITEKIIARASKRERVRPGEIVNADVDMSMTHARLGNMFFRTFKKLGLKVWDPGKMVVLWDHQIPTNSTNTANLAFELERFAKEYGIRHFYYGDGVCHQVMLEKGHVRPGDIVVGTDSHSCSYGAYGALATGIGSTELVWVASKGSIWLKVPKSLKYVVTGMLQPGVMAKDLILDIIGRIGIDGAAYMAMEFQGPVVEQMDLDERMTLCNMAVEADAKNGIVAPDQKVYDALKGMGVSNYQPVFSDPDAEYHKIFEMDVSRLEPTLSAPDNPGNTKKVGELEGIPFNRAVLGTCTGGKIHDLRAAAQVLKGRRIHPDVHLVVVPASQEVFLKAEEEGLIRQFIEAGAVWCNPSCGPCGGMHMGVLGKDDVCLSASPRNFTGRMGDPNAKVYLASPATVAASAIEGKIADPRRFLGGNRK
ncbi:MAG: 3-isopropylmalate dehydratase large subunit [Deltaproteobacteria bacterium]